MASLPQGSTWRHCADPVPEGRHTLQLQWWVSHEDIESIRCCDNIIGIVVQERLHHQQVGEEVPAATTTIAARTVCLVVQLQPNHHGMNSVDVLDTIERIRRVMELTAPLRMQSVPTVEHLVPLRVATVVAPHASLRGAAVNSAYAVQDHRGRDLLT